MTSDDMAVTKDGKTLKKKIQSALLKQIEPFTKTDNIGKITGTEKAENSGLATKVGDFIESFDLNLTGFQNFIKT